MSPNTRARDAYAAAAAPISTERGAEYAVFARITHRLKACDGPDKCAFPQLAQAVFDNQKLWGLLADDLMNDGNALPIELRAQLVSLAEFVRKHSLAVLSGRAQVAALVDINTSIMKGLRGDAEIVA
jgi:flagellar protein FlaF